MLGNAHHPADGAAIRAAIAGNNRVNRRQGAAATAACRQRRRRRPTDRAARRVAQDAAKELTAFDRPFF